jgi:hypothetical protein
MPELEIWFPVAARSLKRWQSLSTTVANSVSCEATIFSIPIHNCSHGTAFEKTWSLLHDAFSKEQDIDMPQGNRIIWDRKTCTLLFGVSKGGGREQVFGVTQAHFPENWHKACGSLGFPHAAPSYTSTHSSQ